VEQPHIEDRGMETPTHTESSRDGRNHTKEASMLLHDARANVGAATSQCRQRNSPQRYTSYMDLMSRCVENDPSYLKEEVKQPVWVDSMVEEYDSIARRIV